MSSDWQPCKELRLHILDPMLPLCYEPRFREYFLLGRQNTRQTISHCPFCGGRLPESLRQCFFDEIERIGIDYELGESIEKLPIELQSDAWWKQH